ncbi:MAG TPA: FAD-dependent oxidoreductase [Gammaproteobacteria bacterium]|nr:FAD-dependent oxidoreductase [Gammaproteobacteria bacterium]
MDKPVLLVLDPGPESRQRVEQELQRRYGEDYQIIGGDSVAAGEARLRELRAAGRQVAVVFADYQLPEGGGVELLAKVRDLALEARRALLVELGDFSCAGVLLQALTFRQADDYIRKPYGSPDEQFYRAVAVLLEEWARQNREQFQLVRVVGKRWAPRSYALRDMLNRSGIPGVFYDVDSPEGRDLLAAVGVGPDRLPVCVLYNGETLIDPSDQELDEAIGVRTTPEPRRYDLAIVGAGPAGLSAAVYAASEGLDTVVVEPDAPGGQAGTSSMVRNYLGFPRGVGGGELMRAAFRQAWLFQSQFVFSREATALRPQESEYVLELSGGYEIRSRAVLLATGVSYRQLGIPAVDRLAGAGVYYGTAASEAQAMSEREVYVVGGGNSAGQAALHLARYARSVTLLVRGGSLSGTMSRYLLDELAETRNLTMRFRTEVVDGAGEHQLERLVLRNRANGEREEVTAGALFILIGGAPRTAWLPTGMARDAHGFLLTGRDLVEQGLDDGWPLERLPLPFETSLPGVFAAGDVRHGAPKRIVAAVGDGSGAVQSVHSHLAGLGG